MSSLTSDAGPAVTVVIPTYNRSWGLRRAVASVLAQTFRDFELILTDDASTDDTPEVARSFSDPRVRYYRQPANVGVARNWGTGVEFARGKFVSLLMDDDRYEPDFLTRRVAALQRHPEAAFAFGGYRIVTADGRPIREFAPQWPDNGVLTGPDLLSATLARDCFVGATLYRTAALRDVWAASERAGYVVDYAANLLLALQPGAAAVFLGGSDLLMAEHAEQISRTQSDTVYRLAADLLIEQCRLTRRRCVRRQLRRELASWLAVWGRKCGADGRKGEAVGCFARAAFTQPHCIPLWAQLARAVCGLLSKERAHFPEQR